MPRIGTRAPSSSAVGRRARATATIARQQRAVDAEEREQLVVPVERRERAEQRARRVRPVGRVHLAAASASRRATRRRCRRRGPAGVVLAQQPLELRRREVRVGHEARPLADQPGVELAAAVGGAPVLPDDRRRDRPAGRALPEQRRLALVRDPDRRQVGRAKAGGRERRLGSLLDAEPDLLRDRARPSRAAGTTARSSR